MVSNFLEQEPFQPSVGATVWPLKVVGENLERGLIFLKAFRMIFTHREVEDQKACGQDLCLYSFDVRTYCTQEAGLIHWTASGQCQGILFDNI